MTIESLKLAYLRAQTKPTAPEDPCWPVVTSFSSFVYAALQSESVSRGTDAMEEIAGKDPELYAIALRGREDYFEVLAWRRAHGLVPSGSVEFAVSQDGKHDPRRAPGSRSFEYQPIKEAAERGLFESL